MEDVQITLQLQPLQPTQIFAYAHESLSLCMKSGNEKVAMPFDLFDFIELYRVWWNITKLNAGQIPTLARPATPSTESVLWINRWINRRSTYSV